MNSDVVAQIASILAPAVLAFLAGHYHIILKQPVLPPVTPVDPTKPTPPVVPPVVPVSPVLLPIGHGGLLQVLSIFLDTIANHPSGTQADKNAAAVAAINAIQPLLVAQVSAK